MITTAEVDVRDLLLDSQTFGPDNIAQLEMVIASPQVREVSQHLQELIARAESGGNTRDRIAAGVTSYLLAQHSRALQLLSEVSGDGLAAFYRGRILIALERYTEAASAFDEAAKDGYDPVDAALQKAAAVRLSGDVDGAEQQLRSVSRQAVTRAEYSYQMGCILADRGDTLGAVEYFERTLDMDPHHTGALFRMAVLNDTVGNDNDAIQLYEQSLSKPPFHLAALINLGLLYEDHERYNAAAFCFRRVLESRPDHERARLYMKDIEASDDMFYDEEADRRRDELNVVLSIPITDFELSARSRNSLTEADIHTLGDLAMISEEQLLGRRNFGETSLREVREIMASKGLQIGQFAGKETAESTSYAIETPANLSPEERAVMEAPVNDLQLSVRCRKCLNRLGVATVGQLLVKTPDELLSIRNFGVTSLNELRAALAERGLSLRND